MKPRAPLWVPLLVLAAPVSHAETTYVIEQLVVGITATTDAESERVAQVKSGDKLEVIEREGDETHVKLSNGKDGWLKSSYLTNDPPLQTRLTERTAEVDKLKQEADRQRQDSDKQRQEADKLKQDVTRLEGELAAARAARNATSDAPPAPVHDTVFLREPERQSSTSWPLLVGVAAVMLFVGFVAGWRTLDRRIRQKYGGLKIY
jgi:SH3 domain-containing protein